MDNHNRTSYEVVAEELGDKFVQLYKLRVFPRDGKILADTLYSAVLEGSSLLNAMSVLADRAKKTEIATTVLVRLSQAGYILSVMTKSGYYTEAESYVLSSYIEKVCARLRELLSAAKSIQAAAERKAKAAAAAEAKKLAEAAAIRGREAEPRRLAEERKPLRPDVAVAAQPSLKKESPVKEQSRSDGFDDPVSDDEFDEMFDDGFDDPV